MQPSPRSSNAIRFGLFEADLSSGELRKRGRKIALQDQPFQVLALLLQRPGELVSREEFQQALWTADTFVEFDEGLNKAIQKLRLALDDSPDNPRFIETLPRKGYRFIAPVDKNSSTSPPLTPQVSVKTRKTEFLAWALFGIASIALAVLGIFQFRQQPANAQVVRFFVSPPDGVRLSLETVPVISPDGRQFVIGVFGNADGKMQLWLRTLDSPVMRMAAVSEETMAPFWSPDSRHVGFFSEGKLKKGGRVGWTAANPGGRVGVHQAWHLEPGWNNSVSCTRLESGACLCRGRRGPDRSSTRPVAPRDRVKLAAVLAGWAPFPLLQPQHRS